MQNNKIGCVKYCICFFYSYYYYKGSHFSLRTNSHYYLTINYDFCINKILISWLLIVSKVVVKCHESLCFSLSPPEVTISLPPGLISLNSTHLSLITLPAVLHHHGLFIHFTPTTLSFEIVYVCVLSRWWHMHCVPFSVSQSSTCFVFFVLLAFFVVY